MTLVAALAALLCSFAGASSSPVGNQAEGFRTAISSPTAVTSLGNTTGKTEIHKTFTKNTAAVGVSVLGSYTVTAGKTLFVTHMDATANLTTISATAAKLGNIQTATPTGVAISSIAFINPTTSQPVIYSKDFAEPMAVPSGAVFMSSASASTASSTDWIWNFDGYEK